LLVCIEKRKKNPGIGFNPDFSRAMFGPHLLKKKFRWDGDIREAVKLWYSDPAAAEQTYGNISMENMFSYARACNQCVGDWDVLSLKDMGMHVL